MKTAANVTIGDRESPLEADSQTDVVRTGDLIGDRCEISPYAGGGLTQKIGKAAKISGVIKRLGQTVGYEIEIDHKPVLVPMKDVFVGRQVLEDIQAPSLYSRAIREALSHWARKETIGVLILRALSACASNSLRLRLARISSSATTAGSF